MSWTKVETPVGTITLESSSQGLTRAWLSSETPSLRDADRDDAAFTDVRAQLAEYFAGRRTRFDLRLAPKGSAFDERTWSELSRIPHGETITYAELARRVGNPKAARAVGGANGRNPLPILVPCHRVIASDGSLGGYSGGLGIKKTLLELERAR